MRPRSASLLFPSLLLVLASPAARAAGPATSARGSQLGIAERPGEPPRPIGFRRTSAFTVRIVFDAPLSDDLAVSDPASYGFTGPYVAAASRMAAESAVDVLIWPAPGGVPIWSTSADDLRATFHALAFGTADDEDLAFLGHLLKDGLPPADEPLGEPVLLARITGRDGDALQPPVTVPTVLAPRQAGCVADPWPDGTQTSPVLAQICETGAVLQILPLDASESTPEAGATLQTWDWSQVMPPCMIPADNDPPGSPDCIFEPGVPLPNPVEDTSDPDAVAFIFETGTPLVYWFRVDVADDAACTDMAFLLLTVLPPPVIEDDPPLVTDADADGTFCPGETLTFQAGITDITDTPPLLPLDWRWDFDTATDSDADTVPDNDADESGTMGTGLLQVEHAYPASGSYTAVLTIRDEDSGIAPISEVCEDSAAVTVDIAAGPTASAGFVPPTTTCGGQTGTDIRLDGEGSDPGGGSVSFRWTTTAGTFQNSGTATSLVEDPVLRLPAGILSADLVLEVTGQNGCTATASLPVLLNPPPTVDAKASGDPSDLDEYEACAEPSGDTLVSLDGLAADPDGGQPIIEWTTTAGAFQDSGTTTSALEDPVLVLPQGTFTADLTLTVTSSEGGCIASDTATVVLHPPATPDAGGPYEACGAADGSADVPLDASGTVPFSPSDQTYMWEVVSGSATLSDPASPTPILQVPAGAGTRTLTVRLTVTTFFGCVTQDETDVTVFAPPVVDAGGPYAVCEGGEVDLDATATPGSGGALQLSWTTDVTGATFSPGTDVEDPTLLVPTGSPDGTVTIEVQEAASATTTCTIAATAPVRVATLPAVDAGGPYEVCGGGTVALDGTATASEGGTLALQWTSEPPGGTFIPSATVEDPVFAAPSTGLTGQLRLSVTETSGGLACGISDTAPLTVLESPSATIQTIGPACLGDSVTLDAVPQGGTGPYTLSWDLGDGSIAGGPSVTHTYSSAGTFLVTLTVTDSAGCSASQTVEVMINPLPIVSFTSDAPGCDGQDVRFDGTAETDATPVEFLWDFGDGATSSREDPIHTYPGPGLYSVQLGARDANGCEAGVEGEVLVRALPEGEIMHDGPACPGDPVMMGVIADDTPRVDWDFGDGSFGTGNPVEHAYAAPDTYDIRARITDEFGCIGFDTAQVRILDLALELDPSGYDDGPLGDGDGFVDPGEVLDLPVVLSNEGPDEAPAAQVRIVSVQGPAAIFRERATAGTLAAGASATLRPAVRVFQAAECGSKVVVEIEGSSRAGRCAVRTFVSFEVGAPVPAAPDSVRQATTDGLRSRMPVLARGPGFWELSWADDRARHLGAGEEVMVKRLTDEGFIYGLPERASEAPGESFDPSLAWLPATGVFGLAWTDDRGGGNDVWFRTLDARGIPSGAPFNLTPAAGASHRPVLVPDAGGFVLVWEDWRTGAPHVMARRLSSFGGPAGDEHDLSGLGEHTRPAAALAPGGRLGVAWEDRGGITFRVFDPSSGDPLSSLRRPDGGPAYGPAVTWNGEHFLVAWIAQNGGTRLRMALYTSDGALVSGATYVAGSDGVTGAPSLASDGAGGAVAAWEAGGRVLLVALGGHGAVGAALDLSRSGGPATEPAVAWAPDTGVYLVAWQAPVSYGTDVFVKRIFPDAGLLCEPVLPPPMPLSAEVKGLRVERTAEGDLAFSWQEAGQGSTYRLHRGPLMGLRLLGYLNETEACTPEPGLTTAVPSGSVHYLVSAVDSLGREGSLGFGDTDGDGFGDLPRPTGAVGCP